jgi:hypothetical protein
LPPGRDPIAWTGRSLQALPFVSSREACRHGPVCNDASLAGSAPAHPARANMRAAARGGRRRRMDTVVASRFNMDLFSEKPDLRDMRC